MSKLELKGKRILVTGGAGFIGSHLVDELIDEYPSALAAIDNLFLGKYENLDHAKTAYPDFRFYEESVADEAAFNKVLNDFNPDVVFNLATVCLPASLEKPYWGYMENVWIGTNCLEALRLKRFQWLIHFSTSEVYGSALSEKIDETHPRDAHTPYASSKVANDNLIAAYEKTFGTRALILRPFNNYGPRQNEGMYAGVIPKTIKALLDGGNAEIYGDGTQTRDFTYVSDCAKLAVEAAKHLDLYGNDYNIGSGAEVEIGWLVREICRQVDPESEPLMRPSRPGDVQRHLADCSRLEAAIGKFPATNFADGLAQTINWYRKKLQEFSR